MWQFAEKQQEQNFGLKDTPYSTIESLGAPIVSGRRQRHLILESLPSCLHIPEPFSVNNALVLVDPCSSIRFLVPIGVLPFSFTDIFATVRLRTLNMQLFWGSLSEVRSIYTSESHGLVNTCCDLVKNICFLISSTELFMKCSGLSFWSMLSLYDTTKDLRMTPPRSMRWILSRCGCT